MRDDGVLAALERVARSEKEQGLDAVDFVTRLLWSYVSDLEKRWQDMELAGEAGPTKDALKNAVAAVRDVREASQLVMQERGKVDKLRKDIAGAVGGGALDLDAARDEIGRRLACLRRAGGG
ncbi:MAG: permease [Paracoccus sp. (in: a-proteobacteria)]|uniref:permease n=1 Tax=Paracoccus sp. TaxID=267 RepID=UPI0026DEF4F7|nr:permease [Paracoccus sp. (in: a-proteobacteria)]MDO5630452.1 permease [Paracoccus sp. (in: a-proteobacteria)]